jgi:hypothetical protein
LGLGERDEVVFGLGTEREKGDNGVGDNAEEEGEDGFDGLRCPLVAEVVHLVDRSVDG